MLFRFSIISDEVDDFLREITIDADATFLDFCEAILNACGYADNQMTSFYLTDDEWGKRCEITREDMGTSLYDEDVYTMGDTTLRSLIDDVPARMKFIFDTFNERALYIQLLEIVPSQHLAKAKVTRSIGDAPEQIIMEQPGDTKAKGKAGANAEGFDSEDFYGSDSFDDEDLGDAGLDISDGRPGDDLNGMR